MYVSYFESFDCMENISCDSLFSMFVNEDGSIVFAMHENALILYTVDNDFEPFVNLSELSALPARRKSPN